MNKILLLALYLGCNCVWPVLLQAQQPVAPRHYVVGVSSHFSREDRTTVFKGILVFILEGMRLGDRVEIYDAANFQLVTQVTIPLDQRFDKNPRARVLNLKTELATLQHFFAANTATTAEADIREPQFLQLAGAQLRTPSESLTIILIGSSLYTDPSEPSFNMTKGFYPSDGHLAVDGKSSVYGIANRKDALSGVTVHHAYLHEEFLNDEHRDRVERFWSLYVAGQGGVLASFADDLPLILQRTVQDIHEPAFKCSIDPTDSKVEMHCIVTRDVTTETTTVKIDQAVSVPTPPVNALAVVPMPTPAPIQSTATDTDSLARLKQGLLTKPIRITLDNRVLFESGSAELSIEGEKILKEIGGAALNQDLAVQICGYTDNQPITGNLLKKFKDNQALSEARAQAASGFLSEIIGVDKKVIQAKGFGEANPIASNDTDQDRAKNRRIEITLTPQPASISRS